MTDEFLVDPVVALHHAATLSVEEVDFIAEYLYRPLSPFGHLLWDNFCRMSVTAAYWLYFRARRRAADGVEAT